MTTVYILLADGFEELEAVAPGDILRRGGVRVQYVSAGGGAVSGARGISLAADAAIGTSDAGEGDYIVIPGGIRGVENLEADPEVSAFLLSASDAGAGLCAICAGPRVLARLGLVDGRSITCYPGMEPEMTGAVCHPEAGVIRDGKLITGRAPGSSIDFGLAILEDIKGKETASDVCGKLVYG